MHRHTYPKPMWNASNAVFMLPKELADKLGIQQEIPAGAILYCPNARIEEDLKAMQRNGQSVWSEKPVVQEFPKALHGPNMQSLTVHNKADLKKALSNGWSLKPLIAESPVDMPPSPDRPPLGLENAVA